MAKPKREKDQPEANFEQDLEQLESIVNALEEGGLTLDESLKRFEDGIQLARRCEKALTETEKRIEILLKNVDGELEAKAFGDDTAAAAAKPASRAATPARTAAHAHDDEDGPGEEPEPAEEEEDGELLF